MFFLTFLAALVTKDLYSQSLSTTSVDLVLNVAEDACPPSLSYNDQMPNDHPLGILFG